MPTTLAAGDIALVGYSADTTADPGATPKSFAFVLLRDVDAGTVINFTDNGWSSATSTLKTNEGTVVWTAPAGGTTAGTVITIFGLTGSFNPSTTGDAVLAYQGTAASPTFLFAIDFADGNTTYAADSTNSNTTALPPGLTLGSTALAFGADNAAYTGPLSGTASQLRAAIATTSNWTQDDANAKPYATGFTVNSGTSAIVSVSNATVVEGDSGDHLLTFTVTRSDTSGAFSVNYATANGSASAGSDYDAASGTLSFAAGGPATQTVSVVVHGDTVYEGDENLTLSLSGLTSATGSAAIGTGTGTGTITEDDPAPPQTVSVAATSADKAEGDAGTTGFTFTVTRSAGAGAGTVDWNVSGLGGSGQATAADFQATFGTVAFAAGETSKVVTVQVVGDTVVEGDESFSVSLSNPSAGLQLGTGSAGGVIRNDDAAAPVTGTPWINEFHYDNASTDVGEFIEIAGPAGLNLSGYTLVLYNGNGGVPYGTLALSGTIPDQQNGYGVVSFAYPSNGLQNGASATEPNGDGFALVAPGGAVVEFLSYEGVITATSGPAAGLTSTDVGFSEPGTANGTSIARVGSGTEGGEFTWTLSGDDTPGTLNGGESIPTAGIRVRVSDVSISEGDAGTKTMTFTVNRAGLPDAFQVTYGTSDVTATAGSDYVGTSGTLSFAAGETVKTVSVTVNGDTGFELTETFRLNLTSATNGAQITDGVGQGTIVNDDIAPVHIYEIQGAGHISPLNNQRVVTEGVVTAIDTTGSRGFWIQDPTGDGDNRTSDAIFVYTGSVPTVSVGQLVRVDGTVDEFTGSDTNNLTITEISSPTITVLGAGVITPTIIGEGGRHVPTEVIGDDNDATFDPTTQAMDFYESIEGMLVTVKNAQAVDATVQGATWVVSDNGAGATGMNSRGGITIAAGDMNPERIQVYTDSGVTSLNPTYVAGDHLGDVTGVVTYFGGQYELIPVSIGNTVSTGAVPRETTTLHGDADQVTIAAYNVENLDPNDPAAKFAQLASDIVNHLGGPNIISLEEVQDSDGAGSGSDFSGAVTVGKLIDAIVAAGGPRYSFVEVVPTAPTGGEPNGHIHQVFLYDPSKVDYVAGSARNLTDNDPTNGDAYNNSRKPLVADFTFHGEQVTVVSIHDYSRGGSQELFGANQPADNSGDQRRTDQTTPVKQFVEALVAQNPNAHVVVTGDFNGFQFETAQTQLESGGALTNLTTLLDPTDRYTYGFGGNAQQIDHLFVSDSLLTNAEFDIVHLNTGTSVRPTDHDPIISRLYVNTAPVGVVDSYAANEDTALIVTAQGGVLVNDTDINSDALTAVLQQGPQHGSLTFNADGSFTYTAAANYNGTDTFTYIARDPSGTSSQVQVVTLNIAAVNDAPVVSGVVTGAATEGGVAVKLDALQGASDVDPGTTLSVVGVPANLPAGVTYDVATKTFTLDPTVAAYNGLAAGQVQVVSVSYGVSDGAATTAQTASWTVTGANDAPTAQADTGAVTNNQSVTIDVLANDTDPDVTDARTIVSVSDTALGGHVSIVGGQLVYAADADAFDLLLPGAKVTDSFTYTMKDSAGATSTATVTVAVAGSAWGAPQVGGNGDSTLNGTSATEYLDGGNGADKLFGNDGADTLNGGNGNDTLSGGQGIDVLVGGNGNDSLNGGTGSDALTGDNGSDTLNGGEGADLLTGGNGSDRFVFSGWFGKDVVADFDNTDVIQLDRAQFANFASVLSHAQQVGGAVVITLDQDDTITLLDTRLSSLNAGDFVFV